MYILVDFFFFTISSVWYEWVFNNDTFTGMHFTMGEPCGAVDREVKVCVKLQVTIHVEHFYIDERNKVRLLISVYVS